MSRLVCLGQGLGVIFTLFFFLQYEPELFPGLIYRMKQPKIVLLIFVSGKIVITGAKVIRLGLYSSFMDTHGILLILFV